MITVICTSENMYNIYKRKNYEKNNWVKNIIYTMLAIFILRTKYFL